jgi:alpha-pyrone synthase
MAGRRAAHIEAIGTAVPSHDVHQAYVDWAAPRLTDPRERALFERMAARADIEHRWSVLPPAHAFADNGFYAANPLPPTSRRMAVYAEAAPALALEAIDALGRQTSLADITHLVVASCTGFVAPGIDQLIARRLGLAPDIERTLIGFMGCYAAVAALRTAHHIVRSDAEACVLVVTVELSTLHLIDARHADSLLAMLQFADGAAAAIVSAAPRGLALTRFFSHALPASGDLIRWTIGDHGFEMHLSGKVPAEIANALADPCLRETILQGRNASETNWAVHAGGRSILDAVARGMELPGDALDRSRAVLRQFGNMSSATLMFVLADVMREAPDRPGIALAFGPGLATEGFAFERAA